MMYVVALFHCISTLKKVVCCWFMIFEMALCSSNFPYYKITVKWKPNLTVEYRAITYLRDLRACFLFKIIMK